MNIYQISKPAHKYLLEEEIKEYFSEKENAHNEIKIIAKFVKFLEKEETILNFQIFAKSNLFLYPKKKVDIKKFKQDLLISTIALFEGKNNYYIVDVSNLEANLLKFDQEYFLYGNFELMENELSVFFCNVLSPLGYYDQNIVDTVTNILKLKNIIA